MDLGDIFRGFSARKSRNLQRTPYSTTTVSSTPDTRPPSGPPSFRLPPLGPPSPVPPAQDPSQVLAGAIMMLSEMLSRTYPLPSDEPRTYSLTSDEHNTVREPDQFDGSNSSQLRIFLAQLELVFKARPRTFNSDTKKVVYALSYLSGTALQWFEPYLLEGESDNPPLFLSDYQAFQNELRTNFGPYDLAGEAEHVLESLRMSNSDRISSYITEFNRLATQVHWGTAALRYQFYRGLPDRLKDHISLIGKPDSLYELRTLAQSLDSCYWERTSEQLRSPSTTTLPASELDSASDAGSEGSHDASSMYSEPRSPTPDLASPLSSTPDLPESDHTESRSTTPELTALDAAPENSQQELSGVPPEAPEDLQIEPLD